MTTLFAGIVAAAVASFTVTAVGISAEMPRWLTLVFAVMAGGLCSYLIA